MTGTPASPPVGALTAQPHSRGAFAVAAGVTCAAIGLGLAGLDASPAGWALFAGMILLLGIPHGAVDHLLAARAFRLAGTSGDLVRIYGAYLGVIALYAGLWLIAPLPALLVFLALSIYHFGQSDTAAAGGSAAVRRGLALSRGALLIGVPIAAHPHLALPIFDRIVGHEVFASWIPLPGGAMVIAGLLIGQHLVVVLTLLPGPAVRRLGEATWTAATGALLVLTHPLVGFAVYFGVWHSLGHIDRLRRVLGDQRRPLSYRRFFRLAAPYTILSLLGLIGLWVAAGALGARSDQLVPLVFVLIALLTAPHMVVVDRAFSKLDMAPNR
jgi:Brp/Blh family beta-carotene 15,15'-monooxygenase